MATREETARHFLNQGYRLVPLWPNTKKIRIKKGQKIDHNAISDPAKLKGQDYGVLIEGRRVGIDIDIKKVDGIKNFRELTEGIQIPKTATTETESGGYHLHFELPEGSDFEGPIKVDELGIEVYTSGRQFCTVKNGYRSNLKPVAVAPVELLERLTTLRKHKDHSAGRNDALSRRAFAMRKKGADSDHIESKLLDLNIELFPDNPLPEREVVEIARKKQRISPEAPHNDLGNAKRLAVTVSNDMRHIADLGVDMVWSSKGWVKDRDETLHGTFANRVIGEMLNEAIDLDTKQGVPLLRHAKASGNASKIKAACDLARMEEPIRTLSDQWDADGDLITFSDGTVLNVRTLESRPMRQADLIRRRINAPFDLKAKCPEFEYLINHLVDGDNDARNWLLQVWSTGLAGDILLSIILVVWGASKSGKTTVVELLKLVLDDLACSPAPEFIIKPRYPNSGNAPNAEIINLQGRRAAFIAEFPPGRLDENKIKTLTGGDTLSVRGLYSNEFIDVRCRLTMTISSNSKPFFDATDQGMLRRVRALHIRNPLDFGKKLERLNAIEWIYNREAAGIAALLIRSLREFIDDGEVLPKATRIEDDTAALNMANDRVGLFLDKRCERGADKWLSKSKLYELYVEFCDEEGHKPFSRRRFHEVMREVHGVSEKKKHGDRCYIGVAVSAL